MVLLNNECYNITEGIEFTNCKQTKKILSNWFKMDGTDSGMVDAHGNSYGWHTNEYTSPIHLNFPSTYAHQETYGNLRSTSTVGGSRKRRRNKIKSKKKKSLPKKNRISKKKNSKNLRRRIRVNGKKSQRRI